MLKLFNVVNYVVLITFVVVLFNEDVVLSVELVVKNVEEEEEEVLKEVVEEDVVG